MLLWVTGDSKKYLGWVTDVNDGRSVDINTAYT